MKKLFLLLAIGCVLAACHSKIDLDNIDPTAKVEMGLVVPVGNFHATLADFLGDVDHMYVDSLENRGVLTWKLDTTIQRNYHQINLADYLSSKTIKLDVYDKLEAAGMIGTDGKITTLPGMPVQISLDFPLTLNLKGINKELAKERLDSALIETASFASTIRPRGGLPLDWSWVDRVTLDLGEQISRRNGNIMTVYTRGDGYGYGDSIPTDVDDFHLVLMKNRHLSPAYWDMYRNNVIDSCTFNVRFTFTIPENTTLTIPASSGFDYKLDVRFIEYSAIWGMFEPSKDMYDEDTINLGDNWGSLDFLTRSKLPFSDPVVDMDIVTKVAGELFIDSAYLFVLDWNKQATYAQFGSTKSRYKRIYFDRDQWLPLDSQIGDSTTNMSYRFDKTPDGGRIDALFENIPHDMGYRFMVKFNEQETPQIRITPNTAIKVNAHCKLPFSFNEGVRVNYNDSITGVKLSKYSIDSLQAESDVIDSVTTSNVKLVLEAHNSIPLHIKAAMRCYDKNDNIIMDPEDPKSPLLLFPNDTITLTPPTMVYEKGAWVQKQPGKTLIVADMTKAKLNVFPQIDHIKYDTFIDDIALQDAYQQGNFNVRLTEDESVVVKIGLTANVDAILKF